MSVLVADMDVDETLADCRQQEVRRQAQPTETKLQIRYSLRGRRDSIRQVDPIAF